MSDRKVITGLILISILTLDISYHPLMGQIDRSNKNYKTELTAMGKGIENLQTSYDYQLVSEKVQYYDGIGRLIQEIARQGAIDHKDIVQPFVYDIYNRQSIQYLPYSSDSILGNFCNDPNFLTDYLNSDQYKFYSLNNYIGVSSTNYPYSKIIYELSPLNRIIEQGTPGATWQPFTTNSNPEILGKTLKFSLEVNTSYEKITKWKFEENPIVLNEYYDSAKLLIDHVIDENQNESFEYKDERGQLILNRNIDGPDEFFDTYYIYDEKGNLLAVLPPEINKELINGDTLTPSLLNKWAFQYTYDQRNRLVEKKSPGVEPLYMVYDQRDRLVLSQDGNLRKFGDWLFTKYDTLNRPVVTGLITLTDTVRENVATWIVSKTHLCESRDDNSSSGYTDTSFPTATDGSNIRYLTYTFYDTYPNFPSLNFTPLNFSRTVPQGTYNFNEALTSVKGQVTATKTRLLTADLSTNEEWVWLTNYYDDRYRIIQTISYNDHLETRDQLSTLYSFSGWVLETRLLHSMPGTSIKEIRREYNYDHAGRLLNGYHELLVDNVSNGKVLLAENKYNALGQLIEKNLHVVSGQPLQSLDYRYNIRGWLKSINQTSLLENPDINPDDLSPDYFGMELYYDSQVPDIDSTSPQ